MASPFLEYIRLLVLLIVYKGHPLRVACPALALAEVNAYEGHPLPVACPGWPTGGLPLAGWPTGGLPFGPARCCRCCGWPADGWPTSGLQQTCRWPAVRHNMSAY